MKHFLKTTVTLLTAALLCAALMTGCTRLTEAKDNTPSTTGTPSAAGEFGVYVKLERDDGRTVYEGEMRSGRTDYEFTIDAYTGAVLEWDTDWDD